MEGYVIIQRFKVSAIVISRPSETKPLLELPHSTYYFDNPLPHLKHAGKTLMNQCTMT